MGVILASRWLPAGTILQAGKPVLLGLSAGKMPALRAWFATERGAS